MSATELRQAADGTGNAGLGLDIEHEHGPVNDGAGVSELTSLQQHPPPPMPQPSAPRRGRPPGRRASDGAVGTRGGKDQETIRKLEQQLTQLKQQLRKAKKDSADALAAKQRELEEIKEEKVRWHSNSRNNKRRMLEVGRLYGGEEEDEESEESDGGGEGEGEDRGDGEGEVDPTSPSPRHPATTTYPIRR